MFGAFSQRWFSVAGKQDDRDVSRSRLTVQLLNQLPSVSATQRQVRDDDVWVKIPRSTVSLLTIGSRDGLETQCDEA